MSTTLCLMKTKRRLILTSLFISLRPVSSKWQSRWRVRSFFFRTAWDGGIFLNYMLSKPSNAHHIEKNLNYRCDYSSLVLSIIRPSRQRKMAVKRPMIYLHSWPSLPRLLMKIQLSMYWHEKNILYSLKHDIKSYVFYFSTSVPKISSLGDKNMHSIKVKSSYYRKNRNSAVMIFQKYHVFSFLLFHIWNVKKTNNNFMDLSSKKSITLIRNRSLRFLSRDPKNTSCRSDSYEARF